MLVRKALTFLIMNQRQKMKSSSLKIKRGDATMIVMRVKTISVRETRYLRKNLMTVDLIILQNKSIILPRHFTRTHLKCSINILI